MADTRIALDYLTDLFAKLAAGDLDPAHVNWPFAAEAWQEVRGEVDQARAERDELRSWLKEIRQNAAFPNDITPNQAVCKLAVIEALAEALLVDEEGRTDG